MKYRNTCWRKIGKKKRFRELTKNVFDFNWVGKSLRNHQFSLIIISDFEYSFLDNTSHLERYLFWLSRRSQSIQESRNTKIHLTLCAFHGKCKILESNKFLGRTLLIHSILMKPYSWVCHWNNWNPSRGMRWWKVLAWKYECIDHSLRHKEFLISMWWLPIPTLLRRAFCD